MSQGKWQNELMNITLLRKLRRLTQADLAHLANITQPTVSRAEKGDDGTTLGVFRAIAAALNVPLSDLFTEGRSRPEAELLEAFRGLSVERQRGWLDLARSVIAEAPQDDQ